MGHQSGISSDIPLGTEIEISHLCTKRPRTGIPSKDYKSLIGKKTAKHIAKNTMLKWEDFE